MVLAIPVGKFLFSVFQDVLHRKRDAGLKVRPSVTVQEILVAGFRLGAVPYLD
jgi:hypothetical protein